MALVMHVSLLPFLWILLCSIFLNDHVAAHGGNPKELPDTCIEGEYHKEKPSPESEDFKECLAWEQNSCCTVNVSDSIHHNRSVELYNFHWDLCGEVSPQCERFLKNQECFYQCEPMLKYWEHPDDGYEGMIRHVPICAEYCEVWFEACKDDKTCAVDWFTDFDYISGVYSCPEGSPCQTYAQTYGNAKGLCEKMWGASFLYHNDSKDCFTMEFDGTGPNPNILRQKYVGPMRSSGTVLMIVAPVIVFLEIFILIFL